MSDINNVGVEGIAKRVNATTYDQLVENTVGNEIDNEVELQCAQDINEYNISDESDIECSQTVAAPIETTPAFKNSVYTLEVTPSENQGVSKKRS